MKQAKLLLRLFIVICFFTTSTLSYAAEVSKGKEKSQIPEGSESTGDAQDAVDNKNEVSKAEKEQSEKEDEESEDSEKDDEEEESKGSSVLRIQASKSDTDTIQGWLENLLDRALDLNNPNDQTILDFWSNLLDQGYTLNQVQSLIDTVGVLKDAIDFWHNGSFFQMGQVNLNDISDLQALFNWANLINLGFTQLNVKMMVVLSNVFMEGVKDNLIHRDLDVRNARDIKIIAGWAQYMREGYSGNEVYNLFRNRLNSKIAALLGSFDIGFFTYMAEDALSKVDGGLDYTCNLLDAMVGVKNGVEALIGPVDILNAPYEDNGFLTYWAEQALNLGVDEVNQILYIWNQILPTVEEFEGKNLNLFNPEESGIVSFWAGKVQELMEGGLGLEDAIAEVIELILHQGEVILTPTQEALIPYVEDLIGETFDVDNPNHMGFLSYWAERADIEGLQGIKDLLDAMANILPSVENLIGPIDLFDENDPGNGFFTYWAERAINEGVAQINQTLYIWSQLIPSIEQKLGRALNLFNGDDSGVVGYWTGEVQTRVDAGMALGNAITEVIVLILQVAPVTYDELIPYIEDLLGIVFNEDTPEHMGFLTYWSQQADIEGLANIEALLAVMVDIKDEVEALDRTTQST